MMSILIFFVVQLQHFLILSHNDKRITGLTVVQREKKTDPLKLTRYISNILQEIPHRKKI